MMIPLINPNRPPKEWFDKTVRAIKRTGRVTDPQAVAGWIWYHQLTSRKKREILKGEKTGTRHNMSKILASYNAGHSSTTLKERSMRTRKRRSTRRKSFSAYVMGARKRRHNPRKRHVRHNIAHSMGGMGSRQIARAYSKKRRKSSTVRRHKVPTTGWHRPRVRYAHGKWYRSRRSRYFTHPTMLNPRRRRRHARRNPVVSRRRYHRRHNPFSVKGILNRQVIMTVGKAGAGIAIGFLATPVIYKFLPTQIKPARKFFGSINLAVGLLMAGLIRNRNVKEIGMYVAATGIYDLIAANVPQLGLPMIPTSATWLENATARLPGAAEATAGSYPVPIAPVSPVARAGMSGTYQSSVRAGYAGGYEAPDMRTQGLGLGTDNPFSDIEGFQD